MSKSRSARKGLAEATLIVASVLLAFWIDAWWDGRRAADLEVALVENLASETESNRIELGEIIDANEQNRLRIFRFVEATPDELAALPEDSVPLLIQGFVESNSFNAETGAALMLIATPVEDRAGARIRRLASQAIRGIDDANEDVERLVRLRDAVWVELGPYAERYVESGFGPYQHVISRGGPDIIAELRRDKDFVAALMHKGAIEAAYTIELRRALTALDSISVTIPSGEK